MTRADTARMPRRRRPSPAVYRRRRLVLLVGVIVVAALVWVLIAQPWRAWAGETVTAPAPTASPAPTSPAPAETPDTAEAPAPAEVPAPAETEAPASGGTPAPAPTTPACIAADVTVEPVTDQQTYPPGQSPQLSVRLTNSGAGACVMNVGTSVQVFTITSGEDVWWRSSDCQTEPADSTVTLAAGQTVSSAAPLAWDRSRSGADTCADPGRPQASGGGASYHLSVTVGGIASAESAQFLLY